MVSISYTTIALILTLVGVLFYGAFVFYGTWSNRHDSRRPTLPDQGLQPDSDPHGHSHSHAQEDEHDA